MQIAVTEGPAGFTRGMLPRMLLLAPASSLTIAFYAVVQTLADGAMRKGQRVGDAKGGGAK